jgi:hydrophobic/amphiphilic exporter-1 (mainly G- bacteria), HAE1 family
VQAGETGRFALVSETGKMYRLGRQRAAFITAHVAAGDINEIVRRVEKVLSGVKLPQGYAFDVGKELVEQADRFNELWLTFGLCIALIYLVLGILTESFVWPIIVLAVVPVSVTVPIIILRLAGQRLVVSVLIGLIALSGMAVNNSILIVEAYRSRGLPGPAGVRQAVLSRLGALSATTGSSTLGLLPLLFAAGEGAAFMRSLAFVTLFGMLGSYAATLFIIPALISIGPGSGRVRR